MFFMVIVFFLGIINEGMTYVRYKLLDHAYKQVPKEVLDSGVWYPLPIFWRLIITGVYFIAITLSYAGMLLIMSFNVGCFIATVGGLTMGHFIFGFLKKKDALNDEK